MGLRERISNLERWEGEDLAERALDLICKGNWTETEQAFLEEFARNKEHKAAGFIATLLRIRGYGTETEPLAGEG